MPGITADCKAASRTSAPRAMAFQRLALIAPVPTSTWLVATAGTIAVGLVIDSVVTSRPCSAR
jgi:hypothetical protein